MASVTLEGDELVVHLTVPEKLASLHRDVRVPSSAIQDVDVEPRPLAAVRGRRRGSGSSCRTGSTCRR